MAQLAEAGGLNPPEYGFESHWGHPGSALRAAGGGSAHSASALRAIE